MLPDQDISRFQAVQLPVKRVDVLLLDGGSHSVDLRLLIGAELYVDPGHALVHPDKVIPNAFFIQKALDLVSGKACREAQGDVVKSQVLQDDGNVDSLSSGKQEFLRCAVDPSRTEMIHRRDVVQRRIEGYCVDHVFPLSGRDAVFRSPAFTLSVFVGIMSYLFINALTRSKSGTSCDFIITRILPLSSIYFRFQPQIHQS